MVPDPHTETERNRRRRSLSSSDALIVVSWLNAANGTAGYRRVLGIRAHLDYIGVMLDTVRQQNGQVESNTNAKIRLHVNLVIERLSRYRLTPTIVCDPKAGILRYNATPKVMRGLVIEVSDGTLTVQVSETAVVNALARLAEKRELWKVRLCEQCREKWRVSERQIDRFCPGKKCRLAFYAQKPDRNVRQREIQRRYRANLKLRQAAEDTVLQ
jgi:hypothetical protein